MKKRESEKELRILATQFKSVAVIGPRQSGKTTLVTKVFKNKPYVNLENPDIRRFAVEDPRGFLSNYPKGAILDEIQRTPELFSYLQQILDESNVNGLFILTGSNNFLLQENISQSLAGRVAYLILLPFSIKEINDKNLNVDQYLYQGCYPALYNKNISPSKYFANYIRTYVERDVRLIKNITNLYAFEKFLRLCAGRVGQLLNMNSIAVEVGVDVKTISSWIGLLETSFIVFRLLPYYKNFNKRVVKMPKLYFYDTGLASSLLGIENVKQLTFHPLRGSLFENFVTVEFLKKRYNEGKQNNLFFWRDNTGNEIDLIFDKSDSLIPLEIKSGQTIVNDFLKGLKFWNKLTKQEGGYIIYAGEIFQKRSNNIKIVPFKKIDMIKI
ncbi:hypothetical protein BMS3Abin04_01863 [bacterium BMS3Abin04]|nr:hypothetical protein BMS3Abin04_01863 [bacterium BMS3Abin04]